MMGHEFVGKVIRSHEPALLGKRVVGELNEGCKNCLYCRSGREKHCISRRVIGLEGKDGCFASFMTLKNHLIHPIPDSLPDELAVFTEPLAAALEIVERLSISPNTDVVIIGDGRLAYLIASVLRLTGANLFVVGKHPEKLKRFSNFARISTLDECKRPMGKASKFPPAKFVVEATGSPSGLFLAMDLVQKQGTIVLKSTYAGNLSLDMSHFAVNEVTLHGSRCGPFEPAIRLLQQGFVRIPKPSYFSLENWEEAFACKDFKAVFRIKKDSLQNPIP